MTFLLSAQNAGRGGQPVGGAASAPPAMTLTIPGFPEGGQIPVKFSQAAPGVAVGEGTSPAMSWANVPSGTQSFFLHMHDMDLARNKTTDDQAHSVLWNIPATATGLNVQYENYDHPTIPSLIDYNIRAICARSGRIGAGIGARIEKSFFNCTQTVP
jgi:phosphatidylethanolamine-binding protein (PEBP) family uncharacterized protein